MSESSESTILKRIATALEAARAVLERFAPGDCRVQYKATQDPVTDADRAVNDVLRRRLVEKGEGWFSEESDDSTDRLERKRVWVVDPLDGTREFVAGIPEWCISVALVENGRTIAGGIHNPSTGETFLGSSKTGVTYNGSRARASVRQRLEGALVLASRSEVKRGEWERFRAASFVIKPLGSVAYKLALVAAGRADATWTLTPKNEWDVAAGVALVEAAGGFVRGLDGFPLTFNNKTPLLPGLVAGGPGLMSELNALHGIARGEQAALSAS